PAEKIAEADASIWHRFGEENAPAVVGELHVLEVGPPFRVHADGRAHVYLVVILEALRPHVPPPLKILRLPVLERALQTLVARKVDVVGDFLSGDHVRFQSNSGLPGCPYMLS